MYPFFSWSARDLCSSAGVNSAGEHLWPATLLWPANHGCILPAVSAALRELLTCDANVALVLFSDVLVVWLVLVSVIISLLVAPVLVLVIISIFTLQFYLLYRYRFLLSFRYSYRYSKLK